jgi:hypothetical protein
MSTNSFIPEGYAQPTSAGGFTKLETGENKLRILSSPLLMWLEWRDGKPTRHLYVQGQPAPAKGAGQKDSVKHSWAVIIWNYKTEKIEVFELDKAGVIASILALSEKPSWGHPKNFDLIITKKGSGMETEYVTTPEPPSEPSNAIVEAYTENPVDLRQLLVEGGNPFIGKASAGNPANPNATPAQSNAKVVTAENWVQGDEIPAGFIINPIDGVGIVKKDLPF